MMASWLWASLRVLHSEQGQDLVEYTLLIAFIAVVAITAITALGRVINETFYAEFADYFLNVLG